MLMEEKVFTINLRKEALKGPKTRKSHASSFIVRKYLKRHMKADNIKIGASINKAIWYRSIKKPPEKIKIKAIKVKDEDDNDVVKAEMWGHVFEEELTKEKPKKEETKTQEKPKETPKESKPEAKEQKKAEEKPEQPEESTKSADK
ncbi:MAG: hypothetical protein COY38_00455 [Candidatus Aenigmarchaeota archaeon CG_4_10_14_0_8_um_filter_37_24]|nr:hypothetical protein [Candidatus Aenigmarchaeota archaeon]PIV68640.1 MAG: hypothetical protein COS07_03420 [Candidatus Aenigmarchaeota archaeon CG01_land_8_20_14_3_00_37_9]PIW40922.1 MAG: hypothetical protein COW21_04615 [Candidatus Aenigmarchaeota archaeon CG15_BIG_FIL_POST_REV_8_21_14_020_37_27]PIX50306.1 MAG: hypothetical protein COZ52_04760 [Candidatus Aenigmarchaeota archaeon CG_4_8_14_3_um_filter_37_24]PIY35060.1 MAG: hypothetical protein COZ04_04730 [Candidatus Aenigmarchaeota archaeo